MKCASDCSQGISGRDEFSVRVSQARNICQPQPRGGRISQPLHRTGNLAPECGRRAAISAICGGNMLLIYSEELNQESQRRVDLEAQLVHVIQRDELELYYQPQQRLSDDALIGFEVLVRWRRGDTVVSPADFIPIAEESGLVIAIGDKVLERACLKIRELLELTGETVVIAVQHCTTSVFASRFSVQD